MGPTAPLNRRRTLLCGLALSLTFPGFAQAAPEGPRTPGDGDAPPPADPVDGPPVQPPAADVAPADPVLALVNAYRALAGVAPASRHPALEHASQAHVNYYDLNRRDGSMQGMGLHMQRKDAPGFTGASMGDRARAAGYAGGSVTENAGFGGMEPAIEWHIHTVNHRLPLIHPSAVDMGFAVSPETGFGIIDVGLRREKVSVPVPSVYPGDGATDVPLRWDGGETPNPAPGVPRPLGYPLTVAFGVQQRVTWQSFSLVGPSGEALPISTPTTEWMRAAAIIPHRPFLPGQVYTARIEANVDGKRVVKEWSFVTRA